MGSSNPSQPTTASGPVPPSVIDTAERVDRRLRDLLDAEQERWVALDADLAAPFRTLRSFVLNGGKRLRPSFCRLGFEAAGGDAGDPVVDDIGAAFELLHAFALIHDDVIDDSAVRRGAATVHTEFTDRHESDGLRGESRRFGEGVAVLVGDLALVYADVLAGALPPAATTVWNELRVELNIGQYLDVLATAQRDNDPARARRIARYKSAKYTIERPLHLGAAVAGGDDALAGALSAYGLPLGEAFQLRDDLLGVFGDAAVLGKPVGDDLREGKSTPLLSLAVERADAAQRKVLDTVGRPDLDAEQIARLQEVVEATGAHEAIEDEIAMLRDEALTALRRAGLAPAVTDALTELAWYVTARER